MTDSPPRLSWVHKADGRLVPFEPDRISRDLFAATERLGTPDAFLARELTDSILHFLTLESEGTIPTTAQVAELAVKVVRELGHAPLAQAFAAGAAAGPPRPVEGTAESTTPLGPSPADVTRHLAAGLSPIQLDRTLARASLREYSLRAVYSRDIAAAHTSGLLVLGNLQTPLELAGSVLGPTQLPPANLLERLYETRGLAGEVAALDGPEYALWETAGRESEVGAFVRQLRLGLAATGLRAVVNLNSRQPPAGTAGLSDGPLFAAGKPASTAADRERMADALLEHLLTGPDPPPDGPLRIDWHLAETDFAPAEAGRMLHLARRAAEGAPVAFVFDRPRRPIALAEGLDRPHPLSLMSIGLDLPGLAAQLPGQFTQEQFAGKLGSLVRLAFAAASQKREFLRRHAAVRPALAGGFLAERARLVLVPVGLDAVVERLSDRPAAETGRVQPAARTLLQHLRAVVQQEARARCLDACLDSLHDFGMGRGTNPAAPESVGTERAAGLTPWVPQVPPRHQLRAAGLLHAEARAGTAAVLFPPEAPPVAGVLADLLRYAWEQTDVCRVRFLRLDQQPRPLPALWDS